MNTESVDIPNNADTLNISLTTYGTRKGNELRVTVSTPRNFWNGAQLTSEEVDKVISHLIEMKHKMDVHNTGIRNS